MIMVQFKLDTNYYSCVVCVLACITCHYTCDTLVYNFTWNQTPYEYIILQQVE